MASRRRTLGIAPSEQVVCLALLAVAVLGAWRYFGRTVEDEARAAGASVRLEELRIVAPEKARVAQDVSAAVNGPRRTSDLARAPSAELPVGGSAELFGLVATLAVGAPPDAAPSAALVEALSRHPTGDA